MGKYSEEWAKRQIEREDWKRDFEHRMVEDRRARARRWRKRGPVGRLISFLSGWGWRDA